MTKNVPKYVKTKKPLKLNKLDAITPTATMVHCCSIYLYKAIPPEACDAFLFISAHNKRFHSFIPFWNFYVYAYTNNTIHTKCTYLVLAIV